MLGVTWATAREDKALCAKSVAAIDAGGVGDYQPEAATTGKADPAPATTPAATTSNGSATCKCGAPITGKFCNECGGATNVGAADPFKNGNGGGK